jgi:hypothetical protein
VTKVADLIEPLAWDGGSDSYSNTKISMNKMSVSQIKPTDISSFN